MSIFSSRSTPSEGRKSTWRFFSSTPAPPVPTIPVQPIPSAHTLRKSSSASASPSIRTHYRTHSSLSEAYGQPGCESSDILRTPSEARKGCMKTTPKEAHSVLNTVVQSADLPMMEESDRRGSYLPVVPIPRPTAPLRPARPLHKATSMAAIGSPSRERESERMNREMAAPAIPLPKSEARPKYRATHVPLSTPSAFIDSPPIPTPFKATLLDISQRPAPTVSDETLVQLQFGFSLEDGSSTSSVTLPVDILRLAGGFLNKFIQGHLDEMKDRADRAAKDDGLVRIVSDVTSIDSKPGMTDGESGTESDLESEEHGSSDFSREEYLKSLWAPSPTAFLAFSEAQATYAKSSLGSRTSKYYTPPKNRATVRNQYTQQSPYPSPSSPLLPQTAPLAVRRRATYLVLPSTEPRGSIIEMKILLMRDAGRWHRIAARLVQGQWTRMEETRVQAVIQELEWAGMDTLLLELRPRVGNPLREEKRDRVIGEEWAPRRHRRMTSKSVKGSTGGVKAGGSGYI